MSYSKEGKWIVRGWVTASECFGCRNKLGHRVEEGKDLHSLQGQLQLSSAGARELGFDYVTEMDGLKLFRKPA